MPEVVREDLDHPAVLDLRTASLADVGPVEVEELRLIGETLFVERKAMAKPVRDLLGPAVASLANTLGGWVLLGVEDDRGIEPGHVKGWEPKGRASAQDYIRDLLKGCVDPVPPFSAKVVELGDGKRVGVVRVAESVDLPHVVAPTGSVWTRGQGGKEPVTSHRDLMALTARGNVARAEADNRLTGLHHVEHVMRQPPDHFPQRSSTMGPDVVVVPHWVVIRIAPIVVPETFADAALCESTVDHAIDTLWDALERKSPEDPDIYRGPIEPFARGLRVFGIRRERWGLRHVAADLVLDSGGVASARFAWHDDDEGDSGHAILAYVRRAITASASLLDACGAIGRCVVRCDFVAPQDCSVYFGTHAGSGKRASDTTTMAHDLVLPVDATELERLDGRWLRELARDCGLPMWEAPVEVPCRDGLGGHTAVEPGESGT